jgi:hypothetical protein
VGTPIQSFFIPQKISGLRLSKLPLSDSLFSALKKLNVATFADLSGTTIKDFRSVSNRGSALFYELKNLTQRVRNGQFDEAGRPTASALNSFGLKTSLAPPPIQAAAGQGGHQLRSDERIFIPQEARGRPISSLQLSARLRNIFRWKSFCILGDLQGIAYAEFAKFRNCGQKTVTELRELVRMIQRVPPIPHAGNVSQESAEPFAALVGDCLKVPASVRDLNFIDLPVSVRLSKILAKRKATRLGDLNEVTIGELKAIRNCGQTTISEVVNLIEKAASGGFTSRMDPNVAWSPVDLASFVDTLVGELSTHQIEVMDLYLSGDKGRLPTLEEVGVKFAVTRERIRQILKKTTEKLRKAGSRRLNAYLLQVERVCRERVSPLTPELFEKWLGETSRSCRFRPAFYARLLCELNPSILACHGRHKASRLERALVTTACEVNRPLPLYEFQWELNERFGPLFARKTLDDLRRCLEQSPIFLRNADDEFILDIHVDQLGLDADTIRGACSKCLSETNEIVACDDLLERLETKGQSCEKLSGDILACLLRGDVKFQELGHKRFRMKICNH